MSTSHDPTMPLASFVAPRARAGGEIAPRPLRSLLQDISRDAGELLATTGELAKRRGERAARLSVASLGTVLAALLLSVLALHDLVAGGVDLGLVTPNAVGYSELARGGGTLLVAFALIGLLALARRRAKAAPRGAAR